MTAGAMKASALTTHILDTAAGKPAAGVTVELFRLDPAGAVNEQSCSTSGDREGTAQVGLVRSGRGAGTFTRTGGAGWWMNAGTWPCVALLRCLADRSSSWLTSPEPSAMAD